MCSYNNNGPDSQDNIQQNTQELRRSWKYFIHFIQGKNILVDEGGVAVCQAK